MSRVLIIGDTHCPCMLSGYIPFLKKVHKKYNCNKVVHIGDLADWASISYHERSPQLNDAEVEFNKAYAQVQRIYRAFPKVTWLIGNHDSLTVRQATTAGIPECALVPYNELWGVDRWEVIPRFGSVVIDGVLYQHGDRGKGGQHAALKNAKDEFCSVVQGHQHAQAGVWYSANQRPTAQGGRIFGMNVGCGVDHKLEAQAYGKKYNSKPIIGCGVVDSGNMATFIPMEL
jgi:predicted phosphodiesterase